ncbi:helix-turn-helix transcriptional regulator [Actinomyces naeslundii]|uniref:helix-turn-helix transcriptional regulator n=1 Tax=Actinomyces naeslundii TaxID=1655 RepID=UPI0010085F09|nr:LuxR C-terminal-related transcriptional regulator [Actinomyces naeslundii]
MDQACSIIAIINNSVIALGCENAFEAEGLPWTVSWFPSLSEVEWPDGRAVVLLDPVLLDRSSPVENIREINRRNVPVVAYSETVIDSVIGEVIAEDVVAFVRMSAPHSELVQAIRDALSGRRHESLDRMKLLLRHDSEKAGDLTPMELKMLECCARGYDDAAVARELNVSLNTVRTYLTRIREKLKASDSGE